MNFVRRHCGTIGTVGLHHMLAIGLCLTHPAVSVAAESIDFNQQIRPILNQHCTACHGGVKQAADVSFIYADRTLDAGIIVPGQPDDSELVARITSEDPDVQMPPPSEQHPPLSASEIDLLKRWIAEGAVWGTHWSFVPPQDSAIPDVSNADWIRQPLDAFVLKRLDALGLAPSSPASPAEWLRRASFDLTGLPPTSEDLNRFLAACDASSSTDEAYTAEVDRLLASSQFGERWAAVWMDLARYADTKGFEKDPPRDIWPYRDWVIRAFNQDMPFDEFTVKQLAGDLLPEQTADNRVATAFHRNTQTNTEGGTDDEEFRIAAVIDRINSTWTIWQATTFGCVQCHSHPYDPIEHSEYYSFMAFFNNTEDVDLDNDFPTLKLPKDPEQAQLMVELDEEQRALRDSLNHDGRQLAEEVTQWDVLTPRHIESSHGELSVDDDQHIRAASGTFPPGCQYTIAFDAHDLTAIRIDILPGDDNPTKWPENGSVLSKLEVSLQTPDGEARELPIREVFADHLAGPYDPMDSIHNGQSGFGGYPKLVGPRWAVFVLDEPLNVAADARLSIKLKQDAQTTGNRAVHLRHFRIATTAETAWTKLAKDPQRQQARQRQRDLVAQMEGLQGTTLPIIRERPTTGSRPTRMFVRGNWLERADLQSPGVPAIFPPVDQQHPNRLSLAKWLVSAGNPLTARVLANRLWAQLFGIGIVETQEDFGSTGTPPSDPLLLDHLAVRLQQHHGWHLKPFLKELVLSSTYRQTHDASPEQHQTDPRNRLLARGPLTRLTAEMIRDQALTSAGLLSEQAGGPSVMPPQPEGVWRAVYSNEQWVTAEGANRYRRGLYTYWRRTSPYPSFLTFDAPTREFCTARRIPTNTPLQALVTLNDPVYNECAAALAQRAVEQADSTVRDRIRWIYQAVTTQLPSALAWDELERLYVDASNDFTPADGPDDDPLNGRADFALTLVANTILNLDSALTK